MKTPNNLTTRPFLKRAAAFLDVVASLAVVVGVGLVLFQVLGPKRQPPPPPGNRDIPVPKQPLSLEGAALVGDRKAQVALLQFSDFECPYCTKFSTQVLPKLQTQYIDNGVLLFAFRHLPLTIHPNADGAALAATCAAAQQKFKPFHDLLFANPKALDANSLKNYSSSSGLDPSAYATCLQTTAPVRVKADVELARSLGVTGTPAFFIGALGADGQLIVRKTIKGNRPMADFRSAIDDALAAR